MVSAADTCTALVSASLPGGAPNTSLRRICSGRSSLSLVFLVELIYVRVGNLDAAAYLVTDNLLGDKAVLDVLLNSSKEMPCSLASLSRSSMEFACICLRISSSLFTSQHRR